MNYDFISLEAAERKQRRYRKKIIPKLYQKAFNKGILRSSKPCFDYDGIPKRRFK